MAGQAGCLPDYSEVCDTKRDAVEDARLYLADTREMGEAVHGDIRRQHIATWRDGMMYLEIFPCQDTDCAVSS
jgi:hypothetical protein